MTDAMCTTIPSQIQGLCNCGSVSLLSGRRPGHGRNNPRSYRAISLLPALADIMERIMVLRLRVKTSELCGRVTFMVGKHLSEVSVSLSGLMCSAAARRDLL